MPSVPKRKPENDAGKLHRLFRLLVLLSSKQGFTLEELGEKLEVTARTVRRDLEIISAAGFSVGQRKSGRRFLEEPADVPSRVTFDPNEATLLREALLVYPDRPVINALLKKLSTLTRTDEDRVGLIISNRIPEHVHRLEESIVQKKQVILNDYRSASSATIRNRRVEPYGFLDGGRMLVAVEVASRTSKQWKVARIGSVTLTDTPASLDVYYEDIAEDPFGTHVKNPDRMALKMQLSLRAAELMKEEYPRTIPFIKAEKSGNTFLFDAEIFSFEPAGRFVLGLMNDVEVLGSPHFLAHLRGRIKSTSLFEQATSGGPELDLR
jgi:predicted DNA-binding transcriptional regulator YafY